MSISSAPLLSHNIKARVSRTIEVYSHKKVMAEGSYFSRIPNEMFRLIVNLLSDSDKISLQFAYPDMSIEHK